MYTKNLEKALIITLMPVVLGLREENLDPVILRNFSCKSLEILSKSELRIIKLILTFFSQDVVPKHRSL